MAIVRMAGVSPNLINGLEAVAPTYLTPLD
jgi:hypothetical protein